MLRALAAGALRQAKQQGSSPLSLEPYRAARISQARHLGSSVAGVGGLRAEGRSAGLCTGITLAQQTSLSGRVPQLLPSAFFTAPGIAGAFYGLQGLKVSHPRARSV